MVQPETLKKIGGGRRGGVAGRNRSAVPDLLRPLRRSLPPADTDRRGLGETLRAWVAPGGNQEYGADGRGDSRGRSSSLAPHAERVSLVRAGGAGSGGSGCQPAVGGTRRQRPADR